jgi:hypothetical protein
MNRLEHIIEPERLWLVWQTASPNRKRVRRIVGEIVRDKANDSAYLRYLEGSDDFEAARDEGFEGYPAFKLTVPEHKQGVMEAFMRRLPPRNRDDFSEYLQTHRLPGNFNSSNMALLGYTGAKLPGDGFEFCIDLDNAQPPFELILEVAGFRHQDTINVNELKLGEAVNFEFEPNNIYDQNAVAIGYKGSKIGYIARAHNEAFRTWKERGYSVNAVIERINGKPERPLIYLFIAVT